MPATWCDTAIVGSGLAGTAVAGRLANTAGRAHRLLLFDSRTPGPGTPYECASERLLMNGPARAMSAISGEPRHLVDWLGSYCENALIPRNTYGRYLRAILDETLRIRPAFSVVHSSIVDIEREGSLYVLRDSHGKEYRAKNVVLALGNLAPDDSFLPSRLCAHRGYIGDPWSFGATDIGDGDIALIGSGLTAFDIIALLDERGYAGRIHLVSRHALVPELENPLARGVDPATLALDTRTPYTLLRTLRRSAQEYSRGGGDWRDVVESIRKISPEIWCRWDYRERRRFLRHLQPFWSVHRYRVPAQTLAAYTRFAQGGRIERHRGRVRNARPLPNGKIRLGVTSTQSNATLEASTVINCTGPNSDVSRSRDPLIRNLLRRGFIRADHLRLGIEATFDLQPLNRSGFPQPHVYTLGAPLRGLFYETTAVPEIKEQASRIANMLLSMQVSIPLEAVS